MQKIFFLFLFITSAILFSSCSDEKVINDSGTEKKLLAVSFDNNSHFTKLNFPSGNIISNDIFHEKNDSYLTTAKIEKFKIFLNNIYALIPDENKIVIIDKNSYQITKTMDFTSEDLVPVDIAFANATEAYIIFKESPKVALLDIYYFQIAKYIELSGEPSAISIVGNQIYLPVPLDDFVCVIDSRYHEVVDELPVDNAPYLIQPNIDGDRFVVISAGTGKLPNDPRESLSAPSVSIIDIQTREIVGSNPLIPSSMDIAYEIPLDFVISNNDWAFLITTNFLIRIDSRDPTYSNKVEEHSYTTLYHNNVINEIYAIDHLDNSSTIYQLSPITGKKTDKTSLQKNILSISVD
ncbi:MAG: hypothetical protein A2X64_08430 [Ignavibacteria bacterium GWF2_33_9]|nr:MAG: hypothetical protein A2X64_08430 [Ignavibacteria bacterium GWF2_33_9]